MRLLGGTADWRTALNGMGINFIARATWMLVTADLNGDIVTSELAIQAKEAGLEVIVWTIECFGPLVNGGGWYYRSIADITASDVLCQLHGS